ncbi:hypothetical protein K466DRAFT_134822 [Polyporus arcularius HHB13444]|uniref:Uncharacterized protein n=1 Tax=Polyporus arcularius HHB13444 TaxID=1314778 RepID=A0A5C3PF81_9APHY|nr:hypothetical protein K466DRAFT_134822 [Polyporus arcularius HHB13444]
MPKRKRSPHFMTLSTRRCSATTEGCVSASCHASCLWTRCSANSQVIFSRGEGSEQQNIAGRVRQPGRRTFREGAGLLYPAGSHPRRGPASSERAELDTRY